MHSFFVLFIRIEALHNRLCYYFFAEEYGGFEGEGLECIRKEWKIMQKEINSNQILIDQRHQYSHFVIVESTKGPSLMIDPHVHVPVLFFAKILFLALGLLNIASHLHRVALIKLIHFPFFCGETIDKILANENFLIVHLLAERVGWIDRLLTLFIVAFTHLF